MLGFFKRLTLHPWTGKPSIYETIKANVGDTGILVDDMLPDDEEFWEGKGIRWVAGGLDGAFGHHAVGGHEEATVRDLVQLLAKQSRHPGNKNRRATYIRLMQEDIIHLIDPLLEALQNAPGVNVQNLYSEAYWMAEHGVHRSVVKVGIALLGQFQSEHHKQLILTLGKHDEFTLYAAVAIQNSFENGNEVLFELAQKTNGWGKIHLVERLEPVTQEIKDWLVRDGFRNNVMNEYLACTCARKGELHMVLADERIDLPCYEGAGDIISALISGGPAEDIDDYEHAPAVIRDFLKHAEHMCTTIGQLVVIIDIFDFLNQDDERWENRHKMGWNSEELGVLREACQTIISSPRWPELVWKGIKSNNSVEQHRSIRAAKVLGLDIWEELFFQLQTKPLNSTAYFELMQTEERERAQTVVAFAERELPLSSIASGPADEMGIGPMFEPHRVLSLLLQDLERFEGIGEKLIQTGLKSPVVNNRHMALRALEAWSRSTVTHGFLPILTEALTTEPDDAVRERIEKLIQGE